MDGQGSYKDAAATAGKLIASKGPSSTKANKQKQIMDFKVRALDFLSIYVKEKGYQGN